MRIASANRNESRNSPSLAMLLPSCFSYGSISYIYRGDSMKEKIIIRVNIVGYFILVASIVALLWLGRTTDISRHAAIMFGILWSTTFFALYSYTWFYAHPKIRKT